MVEIEEGPVLPASSWRVPGAGALLWFDGVVRPQENGRQLAALVYEDYQPMAHRELAKLAAQVAEHHGLMGIRVHHSRGRVPAGEVAFRLLIAAKHRQEALAAMEEFIDRMKRDVPVWKMPEWPAGGGDPDPGSGGSPT
jgi:molybdopterin synthase catalytic subunit